MHYEVEYQVDGETRTDHVDAADAAEAVSRVQSQHADRREFFELIRVQLLVDEDAADSSVAQQA